MTTRPDPPAVGVGVVIGTDDGSILIIKRGSEPGRGLWAVPGGKVRRGETLRDAARREALEETGLRVEVGEVAWVGEHLTEQHHIVLVDFFARVISGTLAPGDDAEEAAWARRDTIDQYELTPTMHDLIEAVWT